jgi:hypothetical protein
VRPRTVTCPAAPDPASLLRRALALPRVSRFRTPPPCSGGLWCCHVSHGFRPRLPAREGSCAATCHTVPDPAFLLGRAPVLPCVTWLRTPPPCSEGSGAATCPTAPDPASLPGEGSGAATCHMAPDPTSLLGRAPMLPHAPRLRTLPPCLGRGGGAPALSCVPRPSESRGP